MFPNYAILRRNFLWSLTDEHEAQTSEKFKQKNCSKSRDMASQF